MFVTAPLSDITHHLWTREALLERVELKQKKRLEMSHYHHYQHHHHHNCSNKHHCHNNHYVQHHNNHRLNYYSPNKVSILPPQSCYTSSSPGWGKKGLCCLLQAAGWQGARSRGTCWACRKRPGQAVRNKGFNIYIYIFFLIFSESI